MCTHRGNIVKSIVRQSGFSFIVLAKRLRISRGTLHNRFKTRNLSYDFIIEVGSAIGFDFSSIFKELRYPKSVSKPQSSSKTEKEEYLMFLNHYSDLLTLTARVLLRAESLDLHDVMIKLIQKKALKNSSKGRGE